MNATMHGGYMAAKKTARKAANKKPTKRASTSQKTNAPSTTKSSWVTDLKANATAARTNGPPDDAIPQIKEIMAFNDAQPSRNTRVSLGSTVEALRDHYGYMGGTVAFRNWIRRYFGRGWEA